MTGVRSGGKVDHWLYSTIKHLSIVLDKSHENHSSTQAILESSGLKPQPPEIPATKGYLAHEHAPTRGTRLRHPPHI